MSWLSGFLGPSLRSDELMIVYVAARCRRAYSGRFAGVGNIADGTEQGLTDRIIKMGDYCTPAYLCLATLP